MSPQPGFADAFALDGQVAVVTGAGSGIGAASARLLAQAGATVICADRNAEGAKTTADAIAADGGSATPCEIDVSDRDAVFELASEVSGQHDRIDVWCNIAGVIDQVLIADMSDEQFNAVFDVNFRGAMYGCQAAVAAMTPAGRGSIINMVSAAIDFPAPDARGLRGEQVRSRTAHPHARDGGWAARDPGQRGRARLHDHGHDLATLPSRGRQRRRGAP